MHAFKKILITAAIAVLSGGVLAYGEPPATGWTLHESYSNVKIYKKNNVNAYVQVVDIGAGAKIELVQVYGGTVNHYGKILKAYKRDTVPTWWTNLGKPTSVVNGTFFFASYSPAPLSYGIRSNYSLVGLGDDGTNTGIRRQMEFFTGSMNGANDYSYSASRLQNGPARDIIVGDPVTQDRSKTSALGRTYLCTLYPQSPSRLLLVLSAKSYTQAQANSDLSAWKCNSGSGVMLDGSGSSQLKTSKIEMMGNSHNGLPDNRTVPQVLVIKNN